MQCVEKIVTLHGKYKRSIAPSNGVRFKLEKLKFPMMMRTKNWQHKRKRPMCLNNLGVISSYLFGTI